MRKGLCSVLWIWMVLFFGVGSLWAAKIQVRILPEKIYPGQAIWVQLVSAVKVDGVEGSFLGQKLLFTSDGQGKRWSSLAAVGLTVSTRSHSLTYRADLPGGAKKDGLLQVAVLPKVFPLERITVKKKFVDLSKADLARVRREKKRLGKLYGRQTPEAMWLAGFTVPVDAKRGSPFGLRRIFNGEPRSPHSGADLLAGPGTPVAAPDAGRVVMAENLFFSGNTVILDHGNGLYTLYAHLEDFAVRKGQTVRRGAILGHVGATGRVTGPHLHWGARLNGVRVDPFSLVALPLASPAVSGETRDIEKGMPPRADRSPGRSIGSP